MSLESQYTLLPQAVTAKFKKDVKMTVDEVAKVVGPEFKEMNENPPPEVVKVRDEMGKKAGRKVAVGDIPADVERYVKEIEKSNPDYDEAQTWATAWSIYCKYKEPGSEHCSMPASGYFTKQACGEDGFEGWGETLMADWEEGSVISPPTSGPGTPYTEMWGSDTPDGVGNVLKRADEVDPLMAGLEFMAEGCPDNLDEAGCEEWEANTEKYKDVVKDLHKAAADALKLADSFKVAKPLRERLTDRQRKLAAEIESCLADDGVMAEGLDDACWEGYEAVGMKVQGGKEVPNCVPVGKQANNLPATVQGWLEWED